MMLLVVACGASVDVKPKTPKKNVNNPTFNLILDKSFGGPERELIFDAFKEWERDTNGVVKFKLASYTFIPEIEEVLPTKKGCTYDVYVERVSSEDAEVKRLDKRESAKVLGYTGSTCEMRVVALVTDRLKNAKVFRQVSFHEAGHLIGLDHIPVPNESLMFPSIDKATACATSLDMKQLCMLYECDWREMKVCD